MWHWIRNISQQYTTHNSIGDYKGCVWHWIRNISQQYTTHNSIGDYKGCVCDIE